MKRDKHMHSAIVVYKPGQATRIKAMNLDKTAAAQISVNNKETKCTLCRANEHGGSQRQKPMRNRAPKQNQNNKKNMQTSTRKKQEGRNGEP